MIKKWWTWSSRIVIAAFLLISVLFLCAVLALRFWILPNIEQYRTYIADSLSQATGQHVTIRKIQANWQYLRPKLVLQGFNIYDQSGTSVLRLGQVESTLSWWTLLRGHIELHTVSIIKPNLAVRRAADGRIYIAGVAINPRDNKRDFADWLLQQPHILISGGQVEWQDDLIKAPLLVLRNTHLHISNFGKRHSFSFSGEPPREIASKIDIRGDFKGAHANEWAKWRGTLFAGAEHFDFGRIHTWLPLFPDLEGQSGPLRIWIGIKNGTLDELTAELSLRNLKGQLDKAMPVLELPAIDGRIGWKKLKRGYSGYVQGLSFSAKRKANDASIDSSFKYLPANAKQPAEMQFNARDLRLEALLPFIPFMPIDPTFRQNLLDITPRGVLKQFDLLWIGDWRNPQRYSIKGDFSNLTFKPYKQIAGMAGITGNIVANDQAGVLLLKTGNAKIELPKVFSDAFLFKSLSGKLNWQINPSHTNFTLSHIAFANADMEGWVNGSYRFIKNASDPTHPGIIDIVGRLTRADARNVGKYLPSRLSPAVHHWVKKSIIAGQSSDVQLRLRGDLKEFPFVDESRGIFQVAVKAANGILEYHEDWPRIENINANIIFRGKRMDVVASRGNIYGVQLNNVRASIDDLVTHQEVIQINGTATGPTNDMLRFIQESPVKDKIGNGTAKFQAVGLGTLSLALQLPLRHLHDTTATGQYKFVDNTINHVDWPTLEKVNGDLEFDQASFSIPRLTGILFGGPLTLSATPMDDARVQIIAQGRAYAKGLQKAFDHPLMQQVQGTTNWRAVIIQQKAGSDVTVDSNLTGLSLDLPAPLAKSANEAVALHVERHMINPQEDSIKLQYGKSASALFMRREKSGRMQVNRGVIGVGNVTPALPASGIWANVALPTINIDEWRRHIKQNKADEAGALNGFTLTANTLEAFENQFNDVKLQARLENDTWIAALQSKEVAGDLTWKHDGAGRLKAHLKYLNLPSSNPDRVADTQTSVDNQLPALDIVADSFQIGQRKWGRLELVALPRGANWRIEKLVLTHPNAVLQADGVWQRTTRSPETRMNIQLNIDNVGRFLAAYGYPGSINRGKASLSGELSWTGAPQAFNYPNLSGGLVLKASEGQFMKVEPGIGKLLGVLSLQALPRRISLDFRDVFSEGFAFDAISATLRVNRGIVYSNDFQMSGPAAKVFLSGDVNLVQETQNVKAKVTPLVGDSVSLASALLGGPAVGLAALLVQKALKNPLGELVSYEYIITGTWDNPKVSKSTAEPRTFERNG